MADLKDSKRIKFVLMKEHPLLGYALSFMIGSYCALSFSLSIALCIIVIVISLFFIVLLTIKRKRSWQFAIFIFMCVGYLLSSASIPKWYKEDYVPPKEGYITGTVESVKNTDYSSEYILTNVTVSSKEIDSNVKITNITQRNYVDAGDKIRLSVTLEKPAVSQREGMFSQSRYYMTKNIQYLCTIFDSRIFVLDTDESIVSENSRWQDKIYKRLSKDFKQPVLGMIYSISTGNKSYMDTQLYSRCADLGIAHIFAISGLHIGAILILWEAYCRKTKKRFLIKIAGSAVLVFILYLIVGSRASLLRAIAMWALIVIYEYAGIKGDLIDYLSIAMIVLLFINPLYVIDLGFILSVSCVGAIALVYVPMAKMKKSDKLNKIFRFYPVSLFLVSLSILSVSWIITAKAFGQVAILSPVWNVIFVPLAVVLLSLLLFYYILFYIPILSTAIVWVISNLSKLIIYLVNSVAFVNIEISTSNISFVTAVLIIGALLLMSDVIVKGRGKLRLIGGAAAVIMIVVVVSIWPKQEKLEVFAGYDAPFVYIHEDDESILVLNEDDGGISRVLKDIDQDVIDVFLYTGNDINDLEELLSDSNDISFGTIIVHEDLLQDYTGQYDYVGVASSKDMIFGDVKIHLIPFRANKTAITHYYAHIDYYDREFIYIDPMRLREGCIENCEILISSSWSKKRIEYVVYANAKYVIINSNDYLMNRTLSSKEDDNIPIFNINNSGSFTYYP